MAWSKSEFALVLALGWSLGFGVCPCWAAKDEGLQQCLAIADSQRRLACYDQLAGRQQSQSLLASTPSSNQTQTSSSAHQAEQQAFGEESIPRQPVASVPEMDARITGAIDGLHKNQILSLDNGQLWMCVDNAPPDDLELKDPLVHIWRNFIGNYWMRFEEVGVSVRVRRIR